MDDVLDDDPVHGAGLERQGPDVPVTLRTPGVRPSRRNSKTLSRATTVRPSPRSEIGHAAGPDVEDEPAHVRGEESLDPLVDAGDRLPADGILVVFIDAPEISLDVLCRAGGRRKGRASVRL